MTPDGPLAALCAVPGRRARARVPAAWLAAVLACGLLPLDAGAQSRPRPALGTTTRPHFPLARVVAVGASVTDGFGNRTRLAKAFDAAIRAAHERPRTMPGGTTFFLRPRLVGRRQMDRALRKRPTFLLALDFLFWYAYGGKSFTVREQDLAAGFAELERFSGPILVGDLPDMHGADPKMLPPYAIPSKDELERLNARIRTWAAKHPNVILAPLSAWVEELRVGGLELVDASGRSRRFTQRELLQWDRLHPTRFGAYVLAGRIAGLLLHSPLGPDLRGRVRLDPLEYAPAPRPASRPAARKH